MNVVIQKGYKPYHISYTEKGKFKTAMVFATSHESAVGEIQYKRGYRRKIKIEVESTYQYSIDEVLFA